MKFIVTRSRVRLLFLALAASSVLSACGGDEETAAGEPLAATSAPPSNAPPAGSPNRAPTISGTPPASVLQGNTYSFTPNAADPDGNTLTFSIANKPAWATFNASTGSLSGTPSPAEIGTYANVTISVSDGAANASLSTFTVRVVATATGSATLTWNPPTLNADGSPLTNLAGYRVYWGTSQGTYTNSVTVNNPGLSTYVIDQLTPATWFFALTAVNSSGTESAHSNTASKQVL